MTSFSIKLGNFLYHNAFWAYRPMYSLFKNRQDAFEIGLLEKYVQPGAVILDIGANIGFYATLLARLAGSRGQVHCFEPDAVNFKHLQKEVAGNKAIIINNKAVGPESKTLKIYTSKNLNVDHRTYKPESYDQEIEIDAVSIDDYVKQKQIAKVDLIKMDIQGFEMQAVQGMKATLQANPNILIISEFWPYGLRKAGSSVSAYFDFLTGEGFNCYLLEKSSLRQLDAQQVKALEPLGEAHYFNIFATRGHV